MRIVGIIVAYEPDPDCLARLCVKLVEAGIDVVVVDNSESDVELTLPIVRRVVRLGFNAGIAAAQNVGVDHAHGLGADAVVFFDQDSRPSGGALEELQRGLRSGVAPVVAPVAIDGCTGRELPSVLLDRHGCVRKVFAREASEPVRADIVISSGTMVLLSVIDAIGRMDEGLFIDYVDIDWCLRCRMAGIEVRILPRAQMVHRIGLREFRVGVIGAAVHSPQRTYYKARNCLLLARRNWVPAVYIVREAVSALVQVAMIIVVESNRWSHLRAYLMGIRHGLIGRTGRYVVISSGSTD